MYIRSFQLSDSFRINDLLRSVLSEECCKETMTALTDQLSWESDLVLVAIEDDMPVGVIIGTVKDGAGYIQRVVVHQDYQRMGCGRALIEALQERFARRRVTIMKAMADEHNAPAFPLYEATGVAIG